MTHTPSHLQDLQSLIGDKGIATGDRWYHGTSSALVDSIQSQGLKRSGDKDMNRAAKSTMATIGNNFTESVEPVFLTQSKELAYFWALETVRKRSVRIEGEEAPVVFELALTEDLQGKVKPDVGAAGMLIVHGGGEYLEFLKARYADAGQTFPELDLSTIAREDYIRILGMAYLDQDVAVEYLTILTAA